MLLFLPGRVRWKILLPFIHSISEQLNIAWCNYDGRSRLIKRKITSHLNWTTMNYVSSTWLCSTPVFNFRKMFNDTLLNSSRVKLFKYYSESTLNVWLCIFLFAKESHIDDTCDSSTHGKHVNNGRWSCANDFLMKISRVEFTNDESKPEAIMIRETSWVESCWKKTPRIIAIAAILLRIS